ncbi:MAG: sensor histidine kinase [Thermoanaerobaculia bacterium]
MRIPQPQIEQLVAWSRKRLPDEPAVLVRESMSEFMRITGGTRALMAWEEPDEPWLHLAFLDRDVFRWTEQPPAKYEPLVHASLDGAFAVVSGDDSSRRVVRRDGSEAEAGIAPIHSLLLRDFSIGSALSVPFEGETATGRVFILDIAFDNADSLFAVGELAGAILAARLDHATYLRSAARDAVRDERHRVARDLHDGLLQSFTGVVLQLETVHGILEDDPARARRLLTEVESMIMADQRELRSYLEQLRPHPPRHEPEFDLRAQMADFVKRFEVQWPTTVELRYGTLDPLLAQSLGWETYRLITEALTNSARHGEATRARVELQSREDRLRIVIDDNGTGFPFRGQYNLTSLMENNLGPTSLCERVAAVNGDMLLESTDSGSRLEIEIPVGWRSE